jgi:pSer/pThr/pTyr-binding forkhead associated (FHA) protein
MPCLIVFEGSETGRKLALEQHNILMIGRDASASFQLLDDEVSRYHLQIKRDGEGRHLAADFESTNGVYVNNSRISEPTLLDGGDVIKIGTHAFVYWTEDDVDAMRVVEAMKQAGHRFEDTDPNLKLPGS